jgi:P-type E1-E2 ATPase
MFELEIPGFGEVLLEHLVTDYTGTLSFDGRLLPGVRERIREVSRFLKVDVLTADTFGMAREELDGVEVVVHVLEGPDHHIQKQSYVKALGPERVLAMGNGMNDRLMLKEAKIGIAVLLGEGASVEAVRAADILVLSPLDAFDLLLNPKRLKATLRF